MAGKYTKIFHRKASKNSKNGIFGVQIYQLATPVCSSSDVEQLCSNDFYKLYFYRSRR
jgi:hypothetical protein